MLCFFICLFPKEKAAGAVVTVGKPERFLRRLFQAACGNHQENGAEGNLV